MRRKKLQKQRRIIISSVFILFISLTVGYAAFQTNITLKVKGNIKGKTISISDLIKNVVTEGDGLYADSTETDRYVYKGADPNNYITLGSDTYRIISVESDGTLKVIKNESIGSMAFDTQGERYSTTSTDYCNSDHGCNVWGSKTTMLNSSGNNVTSMPREIGGAEYNLPDTEATLNTYLNNDWYSSLDDSVKSKIVTHMFNVGNVELTSGQTLATDISQEQAYKWKGKTGLMNISDYVKASTNSACTSAYEYYETSSCYDSSQTHNWIFASLGSSCPWSITSYFNYVDIVFYVFSDGDLRNNYIAMDSRGVSPVFFLSSDITLKGEGTSSSPYVIVS